MHIVIIGNGISGITAARHVRKLSGHRITVISSESRHFFSRTALMYIYMGHMRYEDTKPYEDWFWEKNRINLVYDHVTGIEPTSRTLRLRTHPPMEYDKLLLATGSRPNKFGWPGQDLPGVQGLYSLQDLQSLEKRTKDIRHAVIAGGGLIGVELAEMLKSRGIPVTLLVREEYYWNNVLPEQESRLVTRHIRSHGIDLRLRTELDSILPDENGRAGGVRTKDGDHIHCQFVGLTAGVQPNIDLVRDTPIEADRGILINERMETNIPDIYAAGDCAQFKEPLPGRKAVEQVWYTGKMQGATAALNMCGIKAEYRPGPWFNSAKFFDIEFMTYGTVPNQKEEGLSSLYWEHPDGLKCVHIVYEKSDRRFIGINLLGIRCRHHLFQRFLEEGCSVEQVLQNLAAANFDPEFFPSFEEEVLATYNKEHPGREIRSASSRGWKAVRNYLKLNQ